MFARGSSHTVRVSRCVQSSGNHATSHDRRQPARCASRVGEYAQPDVWRAHGVNGSAMQTTCSVLLTWRGIVQTPLRFYLGAPATLIEASSIVAGHPDHECGFDLCA